MVLLVMDEAHAEAVIFGRNPITRTSTITLPEEILGPHEDRVEVVVRALTYGDSMDIATAIGQLKSVEEKQIAAVLEPLMRCIVSVGGQQLPDDIVERRKLINGWPDAVVSLIYECYFGLESQLRAACSFVGGHPNFFGANGGSSVAPQDSGADKNST